MKLLVLLLVLLVGACDLALEGGPPAGGFLFQPQLACYFKLVVVNSDTGLEEWTYDFDLLCPGEQFETWGHPYGPYLLQLHRADGEVIEVEAVINRFQVPVSDE